jgi:hypothetical protein
MTRPEGRRALHLGPDRHLIREGRHALRSAQHICVGLYGPGGTYTGEGVPPA